MLVQFAKRVTAISLYLSYLKKNFFLFVLVAPNSVWSYVIVGLLGLGWVQDLFLQLKMEFVVETDQEWLSEPDKVAHACNPHVQPCLQSKILSQK